MKQRVLIVTVTAELPRYYEYYDSIDRLVLPPRTGKTSIHSSSPAKNRNIAIASALKNGEFTHLFFTDDDHVYMPDTVMRLLSHNVDIVSGLYCMKFPPFPIIMLNNPNERNMSSFINVHNHGPNELVEVPRVPAGCLMVSTAGLKKMREYMASGANRDYHDKWFTLGHIQPDEWGDDLWFCDRAQEAGLKIYVDTSCRVGHITKCILSPDYVHGEWTIRHQINSEAPVNMIEGLKSDSTRLPFPEQPYNLEEVQKQPLSHQDD